MIRGNRAWLSIRSETKTVAEISRDHRAEAAMTSGDVAGSATGLRTVPVEFWPNM